MQCVIHPETEALDACRTCGKPICAACGGASGGAFVCARCAPPAPAPSGGGSARAERSPVVAAVLSFVPGLGQVYNGDHLLALTLISGLALLLVGSFESPLLAPFLAVLWFYQVFEAYHGAVEDPADLARPGANSTWLSLGLVAAGLLLVVHNLRGEFMPLRLLLPGLVIGFGLRLLLSYFRPGEDHPA